MVLEPETPPRRLKQIGRSAHALHAPGDHAFGVAVVDALDAAYDGLHTGAAGGHDMERRSLDGKTGLYQSDPGHIVVDRLEAVAHDDLIENAFFQAGALHDGLDNEL